MIVTLLRTVLLFSLGTIIYDSHMSFVNSIALSALIISYGMLSFKAGMDV